MSQQSVIAINSAPRLPGRASSISLESLDGSPRNTRRFQPHEHLFMQGDTPKGVFQVLSGTVILYKVMADGRRQIQDFASEGDFLALTFSDIHDLSAEALTDVETQFVPRAAFDRTLQDDPAFRRAVFTLMGDMLHASRDQALLLGRKNAMERTASFLFFLETRFVDPETGYVCVRMSRNDMADYLGLTLETVSRMMNRLKRDGVIDLPRPDQFKVLSRSRLNTCAGELEDDDWYSDASGF